MTEERAHPAEPGRQGDVVGGKYRLDALLGRGGMGSVWRATHVGLGREVAIKLVSRELVRSAEVLRRFDAEAKAAARLQSRHVVQVFDNGVLDDGTPYIAMELLQGQSLAQRLQQQRVMALPEAAQILAGAGKALERAHAAGIVHRDIKPDNIYLATSPDDEGYVVKLLDFGIAKVAFGDAPAHESTRTGALLGTPLYMSPEQARGLKTIDYRTDLYSLGVVAFTMLTGRLAFTSDSFTDLIVRICTQPLPMLLGAAPWLPPTMEAWYQRACAREPAHRFQSAQEMIDALRAAAGVAPAPSIVLSAAVQPPPELGQRVSLPNPLAPTAVPAVSSSPPFAQSTAGGATLQPAGVPMRKTGVAVVLAISLLLVLPVVVVGGLYARGRWTEGSDSRDLALAAPSVAAAAATAAASAAALATRPSPEPASSPPPVPSASASVRVGIAPRLPVSPGTPPAGPKGPPTTTPPKVDLGY